ncbi:FKBP12-associated protein 1 [Spathaspora sp. JA1]|nr:FKBP12-associated protein 1 [Spathaspora sp. JA1]
MEELETEHDPGLTEEEELEEDIYTSSDEEYVDESLGSTIIREIIEGTYTCLVCTGEISPESKIWSCQHCYRVYDIDCIKDWATRGSSTVNRSWRCPSCNVLTQKIPSRFTCWCGKVTNPTTGGVDVPFSCGDTCGAKYPGCVHSCVQQCHPGKHPVCGAMGPMLKCDCGKESRQLPCLITPYDDGWRCESECGVKLCDMGHVCQRGCHSGFCGLCEVSVEMKCYCGDKTLTMKCFEKNLKLCEEGEGERIGIGSCGNTKSVYYDCDIHYETVECQPMESSKQQCKFSPDLITTCYCGKTKVDGEDESYRRTKCTDPVPECSNVCGKLLPCGCTCQFKCHSGDCECTAIKDIKCRCGHESYIAPCKFVQLGYQPICNHKCSVLLNCRKHYHRENCCSEEQAGLERERNKRKAIRNNTRTNFQDDIMSMEAVHICTRPCNRLKACGKHECQALCHNGPCDVCLESTNDDLVCHCGKTIISAPVRCGTKLVCHEQCARETSCGHRAERHECHGDDTSCPKCTVLVKKQCDCGAREVRGVLCSQERVSCGRICTVPKDCGHPCTRTCSPKCTEEGIHLDSSSCQSYCKKVRTNCPHLCKLKCHFNKVGKSSSCDVVRCTESVVVGCECGHLSKTVKCGATLEEASVIGQILDCDETCAAAKRDESLRSAFDVNSESMVPEQPNIPYSDVVVKTFAKQRTWCTRIESIVRNFVQDYNNGRLKKTFHFDPMSSPQRQFIHELASSYKLYTESQDQEPKRSVFIVITRLTTIPEMTIEQAIIHQETIEAENLRQAELKQNDINEALFNAIVIQDVFFGIVKEDLETQLKELVSKYKIESPVFQWIKDSTFVFYSSDWVKNMDVDQENKLYLLVKGFRKVVREKSLAFDCKLCLVDDSTSFILKTEAKEESVPREEYVPKNSNPKNGFEVLQNDDFSIQV